MKKLTRALLTLTVAALLAVPAFSQDEKKSDPAKPAAEKKPASKSADAEKGRKRAAGRRGDAAVEKYFQLPAEIKLTDAQKEQVAALKKEYTPKARELQQKQNRLFTDEQKQARRKAQQDARESGKKGKQLQEAVAAALALTEDQKKQQSELQTAQRDLQKEIRGKLESLLTDAQKAQLPKRGRAAAKNAADPTKPKKANRSKPAKQAKPADNNT